MEPNFAHNVNAVVPVQHGFIYQTLLLLAERNEGIVSMVVVMALKRMRNDTITLVQKALLLLAGSSSKRYNFRLMSFFISGIGGAESSMSMCVDERGCGCGG